MTFEHPPLLAADLTAPLRQMQSPLRFAAQLEAARVRVTSVVATQFVAVNRCIGLGGRHLLDALAPVRRKTPRDTTGLPT